jgi:fructan beta-fructosidase
MTLPRELSLRPDPSGELQLVQRPLAELAGLRGPAISRAGVDLPAGEVELFAPGELPPAHELVIELEAADGGALPSWSLALRADAHEATRVGVDAALGETWIDRSASAWSAPEGGWLGRRAIAWAGSGATRQRLHLVVDSCSVEVFTGDGLAVLTELVFARPGATGVRLQLGAPARLLGVTAWALADAMPGRD